MAKALTPGLIFWKSVTRFMSATDALFRYAGAESKAYVLAYEASKSKKLKGQDFWDHVDSVLKLEAPSKAAALKQAEQEGFTGIASARRRDDCTNRARTRDTRNIDGNRRVPRTLVPGAPSPACDVCQNIILYAILMMAVLAAAAGKAMVNVPAVLVLLPPKSSAQTDLFESLLL